MNRIYIIITTLITVLLSYEYLILNRIVRAKSLFATLRRKVPVFSGLDLAPMAGHTISYWLGWIGFSFMVIMMVYSLRKRIKSMQGLGKLDDWLDFHIFCGILGPIFIIFHSNFKVGGLVAISFWSMIITSVSGIIGRYVYFQLIGDKEAIRGKIHDYEVGFEQLRKYKNIPEEVMNEMKVRAIAVACGADASSHMKMDFWTVMFLSIYSDIKSLFIPIKIADGLPRSLSAILLKYGKAQRKSYFYSYYKKAMGYWHVFHLPFAVFMYIVAVLHIITALLFKVNS